MKFAGLLFLLIPAAFFAVDGGKQDKPEPGFKITLRPALSSHLPVLTRGESLIFELRVTAEAGVEVDQAVLSGNSLHCVAFGPVMPVPKGNPVRLAVGTRISRRLQVPREWFQRSANAAAIDLPLARLRWESPKVKSAARVFRFLDQDVTSARVKLETNKGNMTFVMDPEVAPDHVKNFLYLASCGFYEGTRFHRVIKDFMIQGGCPNSRDNDPADDGQGAGPWTLRAEFSTLPMQRGGLAMARVATSPDSATSQFFILQSQMEQVQLTGKYTLFGRLIAGDDTLDSIAQVPVGMPDGTTPKEPVVLSKVKVFYPE